MATALARDIDDETLLTRLITPLAAGTPARSQARALLERFGSLGATLAASKTEIERTLGPTSALLAERIEHLNEILISVLRDRVADRPVVASSTILRGYLLLRLRHEPREQLRVLYLDCGHGLILDELTGVGTIDHAPVYPREIVRRALELGAKRLLLVHNHPSGDPQASYADRLMTEHVEKAAAIFEIELVDHLIVGRNDLFSLRSNGWTKAVKPPARLLNKAKAGKPMPSRLPTPEGATSSSCDNHIR